MKAEAANRERAIAASTRAWVPVSVTLLPENRTMNPSIAHLFIVNTLILRMASGIEVSGICSRPVPPSAVCRDCR